MNFNDLGLQKIGKIVNTFGIKGQVKFRLEPNFMLVDSLVNKTLFLFDTKENVLPVLVKTEREQGNQIILQLEGYNDINDSQNLVNMFVYIDAKLNLVDDISNNYVDYQVFYNEQLLGKVSGFMDNGYYVTVKIDEPQVLYIPLVDEYVVNIDDNLHKIYVKDIDRLML